MYTENSTPNKEVMGTNEPDNIKNSGAVVQIYAQDDNDTVSNSANLVTISAGAGNDNITNTGSDVKISLDSGNNYVSNSNGSNVEIFGGTGRDNFSNSSSKVSIYGGDDNNSITNTGGSVLISGGAGDNVVDNNASKVTINGGNGKDSIKSFGGDVVIMADAGNDSIFTRLCDGVIIMADAGNDSITIDHHEYSELIETQSAFKTGSQYYHNYSNVTIKGGAGNDVISSKNNNYPYDYRFYYLNSAYVNGDAGDDNINIWAINSTITGGKGNDNISLGYSGNNTFQYTYGDGDDTISGFKYNTEDSDILQITTTESFETMKGGNDLYFLFDKGSITLKNVTTAKVVTISGGSVDDEDTITTTPTTTTTPSTGGGSTTTTKTTTTTTTTEETTTTSTPSVTSGSSGGDTIINNYYDMSGNSGTIVNQSSVGGGVTNSTSVDNSQTIVISGNTWTYNGGDKVITNYQQGEIVELASDYQGIDLKENSFFVKSSTGQLEIQNARDKFVGYSASGQMAAYSYVASGGGDVDGRNYDKAEIMIGADNANNQIFAGNAGSSLWGGIGGNDSMQGGNGYDEFFYAVGGGNDLIQNANNNDLINLASVNLSQIAGVDVNIGQVNINFVDGGNLQIQGDSSVGYQIAEGTFQVDQSTGHWSNK